MHLIHVRTVSVGPAPPLSIQRAFQFRVIGSLLPRVEIPNVVLPFGPRSRGLLLEPYPLLLNLDLNLDLKLKPYLVSLKPDLLKPYLFSLKPYLLKPYLFLLKPYLFRLKPYRRLLLEAAYRCTLPRDFLVRRNLLSL